MSTTVQGTGGAIRVPAGAREVRIRAKVIRANGAVEPDRTVSYWHRNPLWRAWFALKQRMLARIGIHI